MDHHFDAVHAIAIVILYRIWFHSIVIFIIFIGVGVFFRISRFCPTNQNDIRMTAEGTMQMIQKDQLRWMSRHPYWAATFIMMLLVGLTLMMMYVTTRFIVSHLPPNRIRVDAAEIAGLWYAFEEDGSPKLVTVTDAAGGEIGVVIKREDDSQESYDVFVNDNGTMSAATMKLWWVNWTVVHKTPTCMAITNTSGDWYMIWHRLAVPPPADIDAAKADLTAIGVTIA
jgi:hypothetical protein